MPGHLVYEPHFFRRFGFLNETGIVKTAEKTCSTVLRMGILVPVSKQEGPKLRITYLVR